MRETSLPLFSASPFARLHLSSPPRATRAHRTTKNHQSLGNLRLPTGAEHASGSDSNRDASIEISLSRSADDGLQHEREEHQRGENLESTSAPSAPGPLAQVLSPAAAPNNSAPTVGSIAPSFDSELGRLLNGDGGVSRMDPTFFDLCSKANTWERRDTILRALFATSEAVLSLFVAKKGMSLALEGWLQKALDSNEKHHVSSMLKTLSQIPATSAALMPPCKLGNLVNRIVKNKTTVHDDRTVAEARMILARWKKLFPSTAKRAANATNQAVAANAGPLVPRGASNLDVGQAARDTGAPAKQERPAARPERATAASMAAAGAESKKLVEELEKGRGSGTAEKPAKRKAMAADGLEDVDVFASQKKPASRQEIPKSKSSTPASKNAPILKTKRVVASNAAQPQAPAPALRAPQRSTQVARVSANPLDMLGINQSTDRTHTNDPLTAKQQRRVVLASANRSSSLPVSASAAERAAAAAASVPDEPPREKKNMSSTKRKVVWADGWGPNTPPPRPEMLCTERKFLRTDPPINARQDAVFDQAAAQAAMEAGLLNPLQAHQKFEMAARMRDHSEAQALKDFKAREDQERREVEKRLLEITPSVPWMDAPGIPQSILADLSFQPGRGEGSEEAKARPNARRHLEPAPRTLESPEEPFPGSNKPMRPLHLIPNIPLSVEEAAASQTSFSQANAASSTASGRPRRMHGLHGLHGHHGQCNNGKMQSNVPVQQGGAPGQEAMRPQYGPRPGGNEICMWHNTPRGCNFGDKCQFRHIDQASMPSNGRGQAVPMKRPFSSAGQRPMRR